MLTAISALIHAPFILLLVTIIGVMAGITAAHDRGNRK